MARLCLVRVIVLLIVCELVSMHADDYNDQRWWLSSRDPSVLRSHAGVQLSSLVKRQVASQPQPGTSVTLPGGIVIPSGIFDIPDNATGDGLDSYDASLNCKCVQFFQCDGNNSIITSGEGQIDLRLQNDDDVWNVAQCPDSLMRCCKVPPGVTAPPRNTSKPTRKSKCGIRRSSALDSLLRIKDGEETEFGEFPWMLALLKVQTMPSGGEVNIFECGASLIHPQVALTAAHCVKRASKLDPKVQFRIRAGEWDTQSTDELLPYQDRDVTRVIAHETFNSGSLFNDVALLVLSRPLDMEDNIDTICLPEAGDLFDGSECLATGWGREAFGAENPFNTVLRKVTLVMTPAQRCQDELRKTRLGAHFRLNPCFVCAVGRSAGQDTCKGDGGGPLMCPSPLNPGQYTQVGIVSWGVGCGAATPAVYANVAYQRNWIDEKLAGLGFAASGATKA